MERRGVASVHLGKKDIGWQALGPALGCTLLALIVVTARWYTRCRIAKCTGPDDYIILLSMLLSCAMLTLIGAEVHSGVGRYDTHIPATTVAKLIVANNDLWILTVNITKASILFQYLRIFSSRTIRVLCIALLLLLLPAASWGVFGGTFLCTPIAKLWIPQIPGHCMSAQDYWYSVAGIDISLDFLILVLPLPAIVRLRLPPKQKFGLVLVFLLGFFVCVVSIVRVVTVLATSLKGDFVAAGVWAIVWSAVEANVGIICASLLALKPLLVKLCPGLMVEKEGPGHSTRLPMIESGVSLSRSEGGILACPMSRTTCTGPLSPVEESGSFDLEKTLSEAGSGTVPRAFGTKGASVSGVVHSSVEDGLGEHLSFFDMLQEAAREVGAQPKRGHRPGLQRGR